MPSTANEATANQEQRADAQQQEEETAKPRSALRVAVGIRQ